MFFFCAVKFPLKTLNICPNFAYTDMKAVFSFTKGSHVCTAPDNITRVKLTNFVPMLDNIWHSTAKQQPKQAVYFYNEQLCLSFSSCARPPLDIHMECCGLAANCSELTVWLLTVKPLQGDLVVPLVGTSLLRGSNGETMRVCEEALVSHRQLKHTVRSLIQCYPLSISLTFVFILGSLNHVFVFIDCA